MKKFEFKDNSKDIIKKLEKVNGSTANLFPTDFMRKYTNFATFSEMTGKYGKAESAKDLENNTDFDKFVAENTKFSDWEETLEKAKENLINSTFRF